MPKKISILGIFVADLACWATRVPAWGETILGSGFKLGPGGKGSNQAIAAARLGAEVSFITKLGRDTFGDLARRTYAEEGVDATHIHESADQPTGAATIIVDEKRGENAIIVVPGACDHLTVAEIDQAEPAIAASAAFLCQFEAKL